MNIETTEMIKSLKKEIDDINLKIDLQEFGNVISVADGIAQVIGLDNVESGEAIDFQSGAKGIALNLEYDCVSIVIIQGEHLICEGEKVFRTTEFLKVPVGKNVLGRILDGLGNPIDGKNTIECEKYNYVHAPAPTVIDRESVHEPMYTGIKLIDSLIPIGRGQRELIIGDRQIGKTAIAIDTIINQKHTHKTDKPVYCIYVAIGQKCSSVAYIAQKLKEHNAMQYTTIVNTTASDPAAVQYLAPYVGCAIGEYFRDNRMHALVIYDDLSKHAVAYRQMSLLLKRPPGREAYPGDVFFIHSKLLERAAKLSDKRGSGSLTALPIVETQAGDISAYIPTNIISITDGQIFLEESLFFQGIKPAINVGLSVSRVGSAAQIKAMKQVSGQLKLELAQYRELQNFTAFASDLNEETMTLLAQGEKIVNSLKQKQYDPVPVEEQVVILYVLKNHASKVDKSKISHFHKKCIEYIKEKYRHILEEILKQKVITPEIESLLNDVLLEFIKQYNQPAL